MRCGEDGTECALRDVVPKLGGHCTKTRKVGGRDIPWEWACNCPLCSGAGKLTVTAKGRTMLLHCQKCKATQVRLMAKMADLLPACFRAPGQSRGGSRIDPAELAAMALAEMPPVSLRLALLEMSGMSTPDALDKLGVRRENRSRVIKRARIRFDAKPQVSERINLDDP